MDEATAVPSDDGRWHRPGSSIVGTLGPVPFGPAVASPFLRLETPFLAVAGAGIAEKGPLLKIV